MAKSQMKKFLTLIFSRKIQIVNMMRCYYTSTVEGLKFARLTIPSADKDMKLLRCLLECKIVQFGNYLAKIKNKNKAKS